MLSRNLAALPALYFALVIQLADDTVAEPTKVLSSFKCLLDDGLAEHRICQYSNLVLYRAKFLYIYQGPDSPQLPEVVVNWHENVTLEILPMHVSQVPQAWDPTQYEVVRKATITYRPYHRNYYHSLAEAIFAVHLLACTYFQYCQHGDGSDLTAVFIDTIDDPVDWDTTLQSANEALQCLTPRPAYTIKDPKLHDRVILLESAVAGIGNTSRVYSGTSKRFRELYSSPDIQISNQFRQRMADCLGLTFQSPKPHGPYKVTIVNRRYASGRHMINSVTVAKNIKRMEHVAAVRVIYLEDMSLKQQAQVYMHSHIVIFTHGAACGNVIFMSPGTAAIEYSWLPRDATPHNWTTEIISDLSLPITFVGLCTIDRRNIYPQKEKYIYQSDYSALTSEEKLVLLEKGVCPQTPLHGCTDMVMNYAVDWSLLQPAVRLAMAQLHHQQYGIHILDADW